MLPTKDENQPLLDSIQELSRRVKIPELRNSSLDDYIKKNDKLLAVYKAQNEKHKEICRDQKEKHTKEREASRAFLEQVEKRNNSVYSNSTKKDVMLTQQSKMAIMGDMMDSVAHQWKQPLNSLAMLNDMLLDDFKDEIVDEEYINNMTSVSQMQIAHMVNTLSEFRTFFRPSKDRATFFVSECLDSVEVLMKDELIKNNITIEKNIIHDISIFGLTNEFKHLFLNLIGNSIDAFNEKDIRLRKLKITTYKKASQSIIEFEDNALGIPNHIIGSIFEANVTTKEEGKGTGIGLYMSSQIVKKHKGTISVENMDEGARFSIIIQGEDN